MVTVILLLISLQSSVPPQADTSGELPRPVMECRLDTELPLDELWVTVDEKRELRAVPGADSEVTLENLPEGDLRLSFYRGEDLLGKVEIENVERGQVIRVTVRLVPANAILLQELRVSGVEGRIVESEPSPTPQTELGRPISSPSCPPLDSRVIVAGLVERVLDNDSFELSTDERNYVVYAGRATVLRRSPRGRITFHELESGMRVSVKGHIAAGPEDECSVGATEIVVGRP